MAGNEPERARTGLKKGQNGLEKGPQLRCNCGPFSFQVWLFRKFGKPE